MYDKYKPVRFRIIYNLFTNIACALIRVQVWFSMSPDLHRNDMHGFEFKSGEMPPDLHRN